jgi:hypothetical protein
MQSQHYLQKSTIHHTFFIPVCNYKVETNQWPQSTTQLHGNVQLGSFVKSSCLPMSYSLHPILSFVLHSLKFVPHEVSFWRGRANLCPTRPGKVQRGRVAV